MRTRVLADESEMAAFAELERQAAAAREAYLAADASRLHKKRNLKNEWVTAEAALADARVEELHALEDAEMRRSAVARGLVECQREMMEMERQREVMETELQREMMAASRKRGLMERQRETEAIDLLTTSNATRLTNTDLVSSGGPATPRPSVARLAKLAAGSCP